MGSNVRATSTAPTTQPADREVIGFALCSSGSIRDSAVYLCGILTNRTSRDLEIDWIPGVHHFDLKVIDKHGVSWNLADHLPPPQVILPLIVKAAQDIRLEAHFGSPNFPVFTFEANKSPYRFEVTLNSRVLRHSASLVLDVA